MTRFVDDSVMRYSREAKHYDGSNALLFDTRYRSAQLPLFAPEHPAALASDPDGWYTFGKRPASHSLVIPIDGEALAASPAMVDMMDLLRGSRVGSKIAWHVEKMRRHVLHATYSFALPFNPALGPSAAQRSAVGAVPYFRIRLKGLFLGGFNTGRIYLCVYPEARNGAPATDALATALSVAQNRLLLCGFLNLQDELNAEEAKALFDLCRSVQDRVLDEQVCTELAVLEACDDLVLDSVIRDRIALAP